MTEPPTDPQIVEPIPAPEVFVDGYQSSVICNGVVKFTFFTLAHDALTGKMERRVVLRLSAPLPAVAGIHEAMGNLLTEARRTMMQPSEVEQDVHGHH